MLGDFTPGKTVVFDFNTHKADGTPITLAGTPVVSVYKNSTTETTTGVTLTVDYDSRTGLHHVVIDTSADGTFYAAGNDFRAVITTGTVDSVSVIGSVVGAFSLSNRSALRPATADRTIVVDANGLADANMVKAGPTGSGTAQTARDLGLALPAAAPNATGGLPVIGTGTNNFKSDGSANVTFANASIPTVTNLTNLPAAPTDWLTGAAVKSDAVTKIQNGLATTVQIDALNQSASRRVILISSPQYERPESGSNTYIIEARAWDGDGAAVNADSPPSLTATGVVTGSLAGKLGSISNPSTGVYRWNYTVGSTDTLEQVRLDFSATIAASAFTTSYYTQVADFVAATFSTADQANLALAVSQTTGGAIRSAVGLGSANLDTQLTNLPAGVVSSLMAYEVEPGVYFVGAIRLGIMADGTKNNTVGNTFRGRDAADTKDRVVATVDADGNRTAVTRDLT